MLRKYKIYFFICVVLTVIVIVFKTNQSKIEFKHIHIVSDILHTTSRTRFFTTDESSTTTTPTTEPVLNLTSEFLHELYFSEEENLDSYNPYLKLTKQGVQEFETFKSRQHDILAGNNFYQRRKELQIRCNEFANDNKIDLSRMVYDDIHKVIMCVVPKDACTAWKSIMWYLKGKVNKKEDLPRINPNDLILEPIGSTATLNSLPIPEAMRRLLTYTTFFVTRHPFERLVSAYSSKFSDRNGITNYRKTIGQQIALEYITERFPGIKYTQQSGSEYVLEPNVAFFNLSEMDRIVVLDHVNAINTGNATFLQFANYLTQWQYEMKDLDVHWRPQVTLCNPCVMNYDYVIRFEKLVEDSNVLLEYLQQNDPENQKIFFKNKTVSPIGSNRTLQAFETLGDDVIEKIKHIYEDDFNVMGYSPDIHSVNHKPL